MQDVSELFVAGVSGGRVHVAPAGTAPPDGLEEPGAGWTDMGVLSEDGFAVGQETDTTDIKVWPVLATARTIINGQTASFTLAFAQWNAATLALYWGGTWSQDGGVKRLAIPSSRATSRWSLIIDAADGARTYRYLVPAAELSQFEEITHKIGEISTLGVTMNPVASGPDWFELITDDPAVQVVAP